MKKIFGVLLLVAIALGALAVVAPIPTVSAKECVVCPQIAINCGPCANLVPQTCNHCAFCKQIPGCHT